MNCSRVSQHGVHLLSCERKEVWSVELLLLSHYQHPPLLTPLLMSEHLRPDLILNLCVVKKKIQVCIINLKHGAKTFCC